MFLQVVFTAEHCSAKFALDGSRLFVNPFLVMRQFDRSFERFVALKKKICFI
jgi:hypothetical protein